MKRLFFVILTVFLVVSCQDKTNYDAFGNEITSKNAIDNKDAYAKYKELKVGDTVTTKIKATVDAVCKSKGCWMKLNLEDGEQIMVKFKDYGFFVPMDIEGKEVIINGKAFVNQMSVDEQQHYAEDAGKSAEEIAAITKPKKTYSFEADGVLIAQ
jgi:hypothetical protein